MASTEDSTADLGDHGRMRTIVVIFMVFASACGDRVGFVDATSSTIAADGGVLELSDTLEFPGFGYAIDFPSEWETFSSGPLSVLFEEPRETSPTRPGRVDKPAIFFERLAIEAMGDFGIGPESTPRDLAELNVRQFDLGEMREFQDMVVAGAPAASFRSTDTFGNHVATVQGVLDGYAYRLFIHTADGEQLDAYLPTFDAMVESVRPTE